MKVFHKFSLRFPAGSFVSRAIDPALNMAIILVSVLVVVAFIRAGHLRSSAPADQPKRSNDPIGRQVFVEGIDWSKSEQTLLLFLSTKCGYCKQSEPFYHRLNNPPIDHQAVRLIAVFPYPKQTGKEYLESAHIVVDDVRQGPSTDLKVRGTPTLVLIDRRGVVRNEWVGALSPDQEAEVMSLLRAKPAGSVASN